MYAFFWVIPRRLNFYTPTFRNTVCSIFKGTYLPMKMEQSVPKRQHIKFRRRGITQKKATTFRTRRDFEIKNQSIYLYYWQSFRYQHVIVKFVTSFKAVFVKKSSVFLILRATRSCMCFRVTRLHTLAETQRWVKFLTLDWMTILSLIWVNNAAGLNALLRSLGFHGNSTGVLISPYPNHERNKLQRPNSNFCKPLKKNNSEGCPSNQVSAAAMTSASDEIWRTFNCFFQSGRAKDLSVTLYNENFTAGINSKLPSDLCFF